MEPKLMEAEKEMRDYSDSFILSSLKHWGSAFSYRCEERLAIHGQYAAYFDEAKRRGILP